MDPVTYVVIFIDSQSMQCELNIGRFSSEDVVACEILPSNSFGVLSIRPDQNYN